MSEDTVKSRFNITRVIFVWVPNVVVRNLGGLEILLRLPERSDSRLKKDKRDKTHNRDYKL